MGRDGVFIWQGVRLAGTQRGAELFMVLWMISSVTAESLRSVAESMFVPDARCCKNPPPNTKGGHTSALHPETALYILNPPKHAIQQHQAEKPAPAEVFSSAPV